MSKLHCLCVNHADTRTAAEYATYAAGGVHSVRMNLGWAGAQWSSPDVWSWPKVDAKVLRAQDAGLDVLPVLVGVPPWAGRHQSPPTPERMDGWLDATRRLVDRYGNGTTVLRRPLKHWEVWNEPNLGYFWKEERPPVFPDPSEYASLLRLTSQAAWEADPAAHMIVAGLPKPPGTYMRVVLEQADGYFNEVGVHPYMAPGEGAKGVMGRIRLLRSLMNELGHESMPIWVTEIGLGTAGSGNLVTDAPGQALFLRQFFKRLTGNPGLKVERVYWFNDRDTGPSRWDEFCGLFDKAGKPKQSWAEFKATAA